MKISETSLLDLIPEQMRGDRIIKGFAAAWDYLNAKAAEKIPLVNLFDYLELLTDGQLDEVAAAMEIEWYNTGYAREKKINLIRHYEKVCFYLGTVASIESVATDIYEEAIVQDWYYYGTKQWHFKISADFGEYSTEEALQRLIRIVKNIKPAKANLDNVEFLIRIFSEVFTGAVVETCYYFPPIKTRDFICSTVYMGAVTASCYYNMPIT